MGRGKSESARTGIVKEVAGGGEAGGEKWAGEGKGWEKGVGDYGKVDSLIVSNI
jgi:hypothetical protein